MEVDKGDARTLSLLTYNINDEATSESASCGWSLQTQHKHIRNLILDHNPDLLCLQECFSFPDRLTKEYEFHGTARSHRGTCYIGTRKGGPLKVDGPATTVGPCVLVPLRLGDRSLLAACAHLAPFAEFAPMRARQVADIAAAAPAAVPLLLAGDLNMREKEGVAVAQQGLQDAWVEAGSRPEHRWSWNTKVNRYYVEGHAYTARYDRVLYRGGLRVVDFALTANVPCSEEPRHFLSDHFGVVARLQLD